MHINTKIVQAIASAAWCISRNAGLLRFGSGFDTAIGFDFIFNVAYVGFYVCFGMG